MHTDERKSIDRRLARIEGQVRGLRRLVDEDAYCCDILNQVAAVNSALSQVAASVASMHIKNCIIGHGSDSAHSATHKMTKEDALDELDEVLRRMVR
ncbi:MAG: metal-sensitive transcriptional regulator [Fimbriimonadaceae bacterium]|nr:metal-sensitive transcriptional regulator [Fimbriimonadaceae bacterium]